MLSLGTLLSTVCHINILVPVSLVECIKKMSTMTYFDPPTKTIRESSGHGENEWGILLQESGPLKKRALTS